MGEVTDIPDINVWKNGKYLLGWKAFRVFGFFVLCVSTILHIIFDSIPDTVAKLIDDPFPVGVTAIFAGSFFNWIQHFNKFKLTNNDSEFNTGLSNRIEFYSMTFFIVTKLISQITHAGHGNHTATGLTEHLKGGNVFRGFKVLS